MSTRDQVFISYSHDDGRWLKELQTHLEPYVRHTMIVVWDDTMIRPGAIWKDSIRQALASAKVAVLLVSPAFLASKFIAERELPPLLEAAKSEGTAILWVPVRPSSYEVTPIAEYQAAHSPERPLASLSPAARDKALVKICGIIQQEYLR
jgi:internalin A